MNSRKNSRPASCNDTSFTRKTFVKSRTWYYCQCICQCFFRRKEAGMHSNREAFPRYLVWRADVVLNNFEKKKKEGLVKKQKNTTLHQRSTTLNINYIYIILMVPSITDGEISNHIFCSVFTIYIGVSLVGSGFGSISIFLWWPLLGEEITLWK